ncbi:unnamed protein product [Paramecium sonneborni]|uniref:Uncharacterized protein n=1 Tax=Paramecium sonneborni TaxID=65129 RepID=A0A8S1RDL8_9CILI|nr:unnamed protein product [Paramecium sonneborni]
MIQNQQQCLFEGHEYSPILGCCKFYNCNRIKPYCQFCVIDFHAEHLKQLMPLSKISEWIEQKMITHKIFTRQIIEIKQFAKNLDDLIIPLLINQNMNLTDATITDLNLLIIKLMKIDMIEIQLSPKLNELMLQLEILKKDCKSFKQFWVQENNNNQNIDQLNQLVYRKETLKQEITLNSDLQQKINYQNRTEKIKIFFSKQKLNKLKRIKIENDGKTIKGGPDSFGLIFCEPEIPQNIISKFAFQIQKHKWVCIGVCHKSIILQQKYDLNLGKIGHGTYLIENSGWTYSHLEKDINNIEQSFKFSNNDIIVVEISICDKKIIWKKLQTNQVLWKMKIDTSLDLYPCVHIFNSKITILDEY